MPFPGQSTDHAARIARFALGCLHAAAETPVDPADPSLGCVRIRAGFHCGPVVAQVTTPLHTSKQPTDSLPPPTLPSCVTVCKPNLDSRDPLPCPCDSRIDASLIP